MLNKSDIEKILYALKNGVVPDVNLDVLCVGREPELKEFNRCLEFVNNGNSVVKFITGNYGVGKSFLLNAIKQQAIDKNFVVSKIQIDKSLKFNKIEDIYFYIMHNLHINGVDTNGTSFEDIFDKWIENIRIWGHKSQQRELINNIILEMNSYNSSFCTALISFMRAKINRDTELSYAISAWIKGEKNISASVKSKFGIKSDIDKTNALQTLKAFIKLIKLLGYSGMVVLVDEMELIVNQRSDVRRNSYENMRMLVDMSADGELKDTMFVFAGTNELFENEEKGLKTYAALYRRLSNSYEGENIEYRDLRQPVIKIGGLKSEDILKLSNQVLEIYNLAYDCKVQIDRNVIEKYVELSCSKFGNNISQANTREYLKKLIDMLDIMEQNPGVDLFKEEINILNKTNSEFNVEQYKFELDDDIDEDEVIEL